MEIIVTFLAVLEMMKQGILSVEQEDTFRRYYDHIKPGCMMLEKYGILY